MNTAIIAAASLLLATANPKLGSAGKKAEDTAKQTSPVEARQADASAKPKDSAEESKNNTAQPSAPTNTTGRKTGQSSAAEEAGTPITPRPVRVSPELILNRKTLAKLRSQPDQTGLSAAEIMTVRVTVYWKDGIGTDYWTGKGVSSTGRRLINKQSAAVDPDVIPYGSRIILPEVGKELLAIDTGGDVKKRTAAKKLGRDVPVVDIFFEDRDEALKFARNNPLFMEAFILN